MVSVYPVDIDAMVGKTALITQMNWMQVVSVAVPVNSSVVMVFASQTSKNVMEPMTVLMDLMSVQNVNVAQMSSSAKMVLVSQVQGSAMAMQSAWMDLMNKTVIFSNVLMAITLTTTYAAMEEEIVMTAVMKYSAQAPTQ